MYYEQHFPNKQTYHFVRCKKTCPLSFHQRVVYSCLWRAEFGGSLSFITNQTGLNWRTVRNAIQQLILQNLVSKHNSKFFYCAPPDPTWFGWTKDMNHSYLHVGISLNLSMPTTVLYSLLCSLGSKTNGIAKGQTYAGLAVMLGLDARTVRRRLVELSEIKAITIQPYSVVGFDVVVSESVDEIANYFTNKQKTDDKPEQPETDQDDKDDKDDEPKHLTYARNKWSDIFSAERIWYISQYLDRALPGHFDVQSIFWSLEENAKIDNATHLKRPSHADLFWHKVCTWMEKHGYNITPDNGQDWRKIK